MGFFSWLTADTNQSIPVAFSGRHKGPAFLLQPGKPAIREDAYDGNGQFGDTSAYVWLAKANLDDDQISRVTAASNGNKRVDEEMLYMTGVHLQHGRIFRHRDTGVWFSVFHAAPDIYDFPITHLQGTYNTPHEVLGNLHANDAIAQGVLIAEQPFEVKFPLKFSFDPDAVYEDLPASEVCPHQGCYYDDEGDE